MNLKASKNQIPPKESELHRIEPNRLFELTATQQSSTFHSRLMPRYARGSKSITEES